jgi:hypothetical protein
MKKLLVLLSMFIVGCSSVSNENTDVDIITVAGYSIEYESKRFTVLTQSDIFKIYKIMTMNKCHAKDYVQHFGRYTIKEFNQFDYIIDTDYRMDLQSTSLTNSILEDFWITYTPIDNYIQESVDIYFEYNPDEQGFYLRYPKNSKIDFSQVEDQLIEQFAHCM